MSRLKLDMEFNDIIFALSSGNPGAINVIMESLKHGEEIDPDNGFKSWGLAINLDTIGVYDNRIWMLYKDVCRENLSHTIGMARSMQLGIVTAEELNQAIDGKSTIDVEATLAKVCEALPRFNIQ